MTTANGKPGRDWILETRQIELGALKALPPADLAAEEWGYGVADAAGLPAARCYGSLDGRLIVEYVDGITCHQAVSFLTRHNNGDAALQLIETLWDDVTAFQAACTHSTVVRPSLERACYDVRGKLPACLALLDPAALAERLLSGLEQFARWFSNHATVVFRDANSKNCILKGTTVKDLAAYCPDFVERRRHIDFQSTLTLTTGPDDYLSLILHPDVPSDYRERKLRWLRGEFGSEVVSGTSLVRLARLWGRLEYDRRVAPDRYRRRHRPERHALDHFRRLLLESIQEALQWNLFR